MSKTIAALATPPGVSGIAVIRLSGSDSFAIIDKHFEGKSKISECKSHTIHYGIFKNDSGKIDTVLVSIFRGPNSYTGEDSIEISCHGGYIISGIILDNLFNSGAVAALPGEFTKRAFLNGKLDLSQVEAVADLIHSSSVPSAETSARQLLGEFNSRLAIFRKQLIDIASLLELELDFSEEDLELIDKNLIKSRINDAINFCKGLASAYKASEILRSGYFVAIVGYPNSGKSTLFNSLLQKQRAIVSSIAGTTRDYIEETSYINDIPIRFIDTAGIRETEDIIEIEGIKLVESILEQSNLIVILNDYSISQNHSQKLYEELSQKYPNKEIVYTNNKIDESSNFSLDNIQNYTEKSNQLYISAKKQLGIEELKKFISNKASQSTESVNDILINKRHYDLLNAAMHSLENALGALDFFSENEIIAIDVRNACKILGELTGESYNEEVLNNIFGQFCIGK